MRISETANQRRAAFEQSLPEIIPTSNPIYNGQCCTPASFNEDYVAAARDMNPYFVGPRYHSHTNVNAGFVFSPLNARFLLSVLAPKVSRLVYNSTTGICRTTATRPTLPSSATWCAMPAWITEYIVTSAAAITAASWPELASTLQVTAVVNLRAEYQDVFSAPAPLAYLWLPVADHTEPPAHQLLCGVRFLQTAVHVQQRTLVHCKMGIGRSTTLAAAYLIWQGQPIDTAIQQVETAHGYHPIINRLALM